MPAAGPRVLALDIGGTKLAAGVGHVDGEITRQATAPTLAAEGGEAVLKRALDLARDCYDQECTTGGELPVVGVSTMGYTRSRGVELAPNVPGWHSLDIPDALQRVFPEQRIVIGNDVKVATRAEMSWGALKKVDHGLYLNLGTGIAAGVVVNGRLLEGAHGAAGEVGYTLSRAWLDDGRPAPAGTAAFEDRFGGAGVARRLAGTELPATVAEVVAREDDDPAARTFLRELWTEIAVLVANLCCALDPKVLAVGGGYVRGGSRLIPRVREIVAHAVPYPPTIVTARFGADASLRGAAAAALAAIGAAP
ncbi:MAG: ROK family protein [Solirubrobacteraceae bacterium]